MNSDFLSHTLGSPATLPTIPKPFMFCFLGLLRHVQGHCNSLVGGGSVAGAVSVFVSLQEPVVVVTGTHLEVQHERARQRADAVRRRGLAVAA